MPSNHKAKPASEQKQHPSEEKRSSGNATAQKRNRTRAGASTPAAAPSNKTWVRADLHIHTPASHDYEEPTVSYLDILRQAERRGLRLIAFTDHNTVNGYRAMQEEIRQLEWLERLGRIQPDEQGRLNEYRRLLGKIVVLPGFEFTATFGFHVLGLFAPTTPLRDLEHILMELRVPSSVIDKGLTEAGATSDVLTAYKLIDEAGGIAIAAHANSSNGVSMRGFNIGGQTRIAFTQDPHLHAIEFTDLDRGRHSSAQLFSGTRPEYPRRMFALQGSDAHRLSASKGTPKRLGVGERCTEFLLEEVSFEALRRLLQSQHFDHVRPVFDVLDLPEDPLVSAQRSGPSAKVAFHPNLPRRGSARLTAALHAVLSDVCAMANGEGGTILIGCSPNPNEKPSGVDDPATFIQSLSEAIAAHIRPALKPSLALRSVKTATVVEVSVPAGDDAPYQLDEVFYVRDGATTRKATREEIVAIARRGYVKASSPTPAPAQPKPKPQHVPAQKPKPAPPPPAPASKAERAPEVAPAPQPQQPLIETPSAPIEPPMPGTPRTGVQIVGAEVRDGMHYFTIRDLRNNSIIRNVTHKSARDLWLYAIQRYAEPLDEATIPWQGDRAVLSYEMRAGKMRADLALRDANGKVTVFYGVTEDGLDETWRALLSAHAPSTEKAEVQIAPEVG